MTVKTWTRRMMVALVLAGAGGLAAACGGDDDDSGGGGTTLTACAVLCDSASGFTSCTSYPGQTEAECQATAEQDCGAPAEEVVFRTGCDCPGFDEPTECTDLPAWAM